MDKKVKDQIKNLLDEHACKELDDMLNRYMQDRTMDNLMSFFARGAKNYKPKYKDHDYEDQNNA